jgi:Polyketide cyclase / dehydrase and lipid transport
MLGVLGVGAAAVYTLIVEGAVTIDVGVGRRRRALGPIRKDVAAPREVVFDVISAPYFGKAPRVMRAELEVLERATDMVLAAHHTDIGGGRTTTTVETVRFERPDRINFRLVRGPVPEVVETFELAVAADGGTTLSYTGTLATDWWGLGARWGQLVAHKWEETVGSSLERIAAEAERLAAAHLRSRGPRG